MTFDYSTMFNADCVTEVNNRQKSLSGNGPARLMGLVRCEQEFIKIGDSNQITRAKAAQLVVLLDAVIVIIFILAVFRLRYYEELFEKDRQLK
jgi:hypothetical protein